MSALARRLGPALLFASLAAPASAQPAAQPSPQPSPPSRLGATVIQPPASVDPGMKVTPKATPHLPTPVVHPPVQKGDTVIVPK